MKTMYVWMDYLCMPQLSSVQTTKTDATVVNHSNAGCPSEQCAIPSQDHSKGDSADSKLLTLAVQSLPAYVEMCCMMLVLVPTGEHRDRAGEIVDWCSWRRRGWCRLEFSAAQLCRRRVPVMVVRNDVPEFVSAADALLLPPGWVGGSGVLGPLFSVLLLVLLSVLVSDWIVVCLRSDWPRPVSVFGLDRCLSSFGLAPARVCLRIGSLSVFVRIGPARVCLRIGSLSVFVRIGLARAVSVFFCFERHFSPP
jgi:hypothetical protein